jgi:hypothetical protein
MTVPGTQCRAHERIHPGLPAHLRHHGRTLLAVGFVRHRASIAETRRTAHDGLVYVVVMTTSIRGKLCV